MKAAMNSLSKFIIVAVVLLSAGKLLSQGGGNAIDLYNENYLAHGDFIDCGSPDYGFTNKLTVCAWVKWNVNPQNYVNNHNEQEGRNADIIVIDRHDYKDNGQFWLQHSNTNSKFQWQVQTTSSRKNVQSTTTPASGIWYYIAGVYDDTDPSNSMKIYVNGVLEGSDNNLSGNISAYSSFLRLNIGRLPSGYRLFAGEMDEIRIYKRALSQDEIRKQMIAPLTIDTTSLVSYWCFNQSNGILINDYGFQQTHGKFYSALVDVHDTTSVPYYTLWDNDKTWITNQWAGKKITTIAGNGAGEINRISTNTLFILTLQNPWVTPPKLDDYGANGGMTWYGIEDSTETIQWVKSTAQIGTYYSFIKTQSQTTTGEAGGNVSVTITSTPGNTDNLGVYVYGSLNGPSVSSGETFPIGIDRRSNIVWGIHEWGTISADISIDFSQIQGISNAASLRLLRRSKNTSSWSEVPGVSFNTTNKTLTLSGTSTFYEYSLGGSSENPMPVTMKYFNYKVSENNVSLEWATENEINNKGFYIERKSGDGIWSEIGFINGKGNSSAVTEYRFDDLKLASGEYLYRLKQVDFNGTNEYYTLQNTVTIGAPVQFDVSQNYPNPSNPNSKISFKIPGKSYVTLTIYDLTGKEIKKLINSYLDGGYFTVDMDGSSMASGIYLYRFEAVNEINSFVKTCKFVLIK